MNNRTKRYFPMMIVSGLIALTFAANAHAGFLEQMQSIAGPDYSGGAPAAPEPQVTTPALAKFSAIGKFTSATINAGSCPDIKESPFATYCSSGPDKCFQFNIAAPVAATAPAKTSTFSACLTFDNTGTGPGNICFSGQGLATLSASSGATVTMSMGGDICVADLVGTTTPFAVHFVSSGGYVVIGGTGAYSTAVGDGGFTFSLYDAAVTALPYTGPGEINLTGNLAK